MEFHACIDVESLGTIARGVHSHVSSLLLPFNDLASNCGTFVGRILPYGRRPARRMVRIERFGKAQAREIRRFPGPRLSISKEPRTPSRYHMIVD